MWLGVGINSLWAFNFILFTYFLIDYGVIGILFARLLAYVIHSIVAMSLIQSKYIFPKKQLE